MQLIMYVYLNCGYVIANMLLALVITHTHTDVIRLLASLRHTRRQVRVTYYVVVNK